MLKIIQPSDVYIKANLTGCIYGPPGLLKTTLAFTAENPLLLDFDEGVHRAEFRRAFVAVPDWKEVAGMERSDFDVFDTVILDTAGRALDKLAVNIIERNPKMATSGGGLSLQGFGQLKTEFATFLNRLKSYNLDVLLVVHMLEEKRGDEIVERIDAQGASRHEIYKSADFMGRLSVERDGSIVLNFSPSDTGFGKNPGNLQPMKFKTPIEPSAMHMAKVFAMTKQRINAMTEDQRVVSAALEAWRDRVNAADGAEALTELIADVPTDPRVMENAKRVLNSIANDKGFRYDKESTRFVPKTPAANGGAQSPQPAVEAKAESPAPSSTLPSGANPDGNRQRLISLLDERYPDPEKREKAFKQADAAVFFKGKPKGARPSPADLSDMDVAIMLHAIDTNAVSI